MSFVHGNKLMSMTLSVAPPGVATSVRVNKKNEGGRTNQKGHHYFGVGREGGRAQNKEIEAQSVTAQISSTQFAFVFVT